MAQDRLRIAALVAVEDWPDDGGFLVRALVRSGETNRDVIGPHLATSPAEVRQTLLQVCDLVIAMIQKAS
jgi:hypothetical protein